MTEQNEFQPSLLPKSLSKRALQGAAIAQVLLVIFLLSSENIVFGVCVLFPMLSVSVGGALGGSYYSFMDHLRNQGSWEKAFATFASLLVYSILLWLSLVAALNFTGHWD